MLKKILNLEGAQKLTKNEQKTIKGGALQCYVEGVCIEINFKCIEAQCKPSFP